MKLSEYLSEKRGRQIELARAINVHAPDVSRWAKGTRPIPVTYGAKIEYATGGEVTRKEMFPNDWMQIWPELLSLEVDERDQCKNHNRRKTDIKKESLK